MDSTNEWAYSPDDGVELPPTSMLPPSVVLPPARSTVARRFRGMVAGVGVVGLIGGAAFAARTLAGPSENTPTEAVQSLMAAASKNDVISVMEQMAPGERNILIENGVPILEELKRLDVLAPNMNLASVDGATVAFAGQSFSESFVRDDIASVKVSGGTVTVGGAATKIFGGVVKEAIGNESLADKKPTAEKFDATTLTTIKRKGRWYVSGLYSVAEAARVSTGKPMPSVEQSVSAVGADSPEAALRQLLEAGAVLDMRKAISLMDPEELSALQDYAPLFLESTEAPLTQARKQFSMTFPNLKITSSRSGNVTRVKVAEWSIDAKVADFEGQPARLVFEGDCATVTAKGKTSKRCGGEISQLTSDVLGSESAPFGLNLSNPASTTAELVVVERNGKWFVAPIRSAMDGLLVKLRATKPADFKNSGGPLGLIPGFDAFGSLLGGQLPFLSPGQEFQTDSLPAETGLFNGEISDTLPE